MPETRQTTLDPMDPNMTPTPSTRTPRTVGASIGKTSVYTATVMSLYDDNKREILGNSYTFIETRGLVNIPRAAALALESPGGLIGAAAATVGKLIGGGAIGRPTDTIFRSNKASSRALSLTAVTDTLLQEAVKPGERYYVKTNPSPALLGSFNSLKNKTNLKNGQAVSAAVSALNTYGSKTGLKNFKNNLKNKTKSDTIYGAKYMPDDKGNINDADYLYSTHYIDTDGQMKPRKNAIIKGIESNIRSKNEDKDAMYNSTWESQTDELIATTVYDSENIDTKTIKNFIKDTQPKINIPYVLFKVYGDTKDGNRSILLPATITNLSEQFTPAINSFKYIGSPFNLYRYAGIERVLSFDMKLYYTDGVTKQSMIKKLNLLREYTFPDRNLTTITYPGSNEQYSPITFNPNILQLTINGLYKDLYCIIETMTFTIEDNIPWATQNNLDGAAIGETKPHPTVINVALSLKIIEHPSVKKEKGVNIFEYEKSENGKYTNYFTGYNEKTIAYGEMPFGGGNLNINYDINNTPNTIDS